jgi:hypothetical protein
VLWILFLNADGTVKAHQGINRTSGTFAGDIGRPWPWGVGTVGDVNGDGIPDVAAADADDGLAGNYGAVWILFGDGAPATLCGAAPATGCAEPAKAQLKLNNRLGDRGDGFGWKWRSWAGIPPMLGDPIAGTSYSVCVWDTTAGAPVHAASLEVSSGAG